MSKKLSLVPQTSSEHLPKNEIGFTDPTNPWVFCFEHDGSIKTVNFKDLISHCKRKAIAVKKPDLAEDFSQWAVQANLERIANGNTKNGHLNNVDWLWKEYLIRNLGDKKHKGKYTINRHLVSYDNLRNDDGGNFLNNISDTQNLNPEEALILKEELLFRPEEIKEALRDKRKERANHRLKVEERRNNRLEQENNLFVFLLNRTEGLGIGFYYLRELAKDFGVSSACFNRIAMRLIARKMLIIKNNFYYLPTGVNQEQEQNLEQVS